MYLNTIKRSAGHVDDCIAKSGIVYKSVTESVITETT